ncbi:MAG TPA: TetR/AcrR family transcriptional regulator [Acidimicrobiales bacterium]|nr:TetR/AcrR family transcriptional regulator [Acidimicrobiales bacterium]
MTARAAAVAETREGIVAAARAAHAERGVLATSWDDIAARAGVSTATVYRHFPSLRELIPACARSVFDVIQPPTVEEASATFAVLDRATDRLERLVRDSCHCYAEGRDWLHAAHRERDFVPELSDALDVIEGTLAVLVTAAAGRRLPKLDHRTLFVLCDFPFWWSLHNAGLSPRAVEETVVRLVHTEAARVGLD